VGCLTSLDETLCSPLPGELASLVEFDACFDLPWFKGIMVFCVEKPCDEDINYNTSTSTPAAPFPAPSDAPSPQAPASSSSGSITRARARDLNFVMLLKNEGPEE
jgi:hypothetical protein